MKNKFDEIFNEMNMDVKLRNLIVDYDLKDGRSVHKAIQLFQYGNQSDDEIVEYIRKKELPASARIGSVVEVFGAYNIKELEEIATSPAAFCVDKKVIYADMELIRKSMRKIAKNVYLIDMD